MWEEGGGDLGVDLPRCTCTLPAGCCPEADSSCTWSFQQWRQLQQMENDWELQQQANHVSISVTSSNTLWTQSGSVTLLFTSIVFFLALAQRPSLNSSHPVTASSYNTNMPCFHGEHSAVHESHKVQPSAKSPLVSPTQAAVGAYEEWTVTIRLAGVTLSILYIRTIMLY